MKKMRFMLFPFIGFLLTFLSLFLLLKEERFSDRRRREIEENLVNLRQSGLFSEALAMIDREKLSDDPEFRKIRFDLLMKEGMLWQAVSLVDRHPDLLQDQKVLLDLCDLYHDKGLVAEAYELLKEKYLDLSEGADVLADVEEGQSGGRAEEIVNRLLNLLRELSFKEFEADRLMAWYHGHCLAISPDGAFLADGKGRRVSSSFDELIVTEEGFIGRKGGLTLALDRRGETVGPISREQWSEIQHKPVKSELAESYPMLGAEAGSDGESTYRIRTLIDADEPGADHLIRIFQEEGYYGFLLGDELLIEAEFDALTEVNSRGICFALQEGRWYILYFLALME